MLELKKKQVENRKIGSLDVSPIGMGCMGLSHGYGRIPEEAYSIEAIRRAHEFGCTFYDTAEAYGPNLKEPGHNEKIVGKAVKEFRKGVALATKLFIPSDELKEHTLYDVIKGHLTRSLTRLQTDYADLYYLHRLNPEVPVEDVAEVMGRLIREGLIREWGLSQVDTDTIARANSVTPLAAVQNIYNMLERDCEAEVFPYCMEHGITVVPFSPIASGFLSGKITVDTQFETVDDVRNVVPQLTKQNIAANMPIVDVLNKFAERNDATPAQISLAWMLHKYPNVVPIPGSKNQERILENLGAWNVKLDDASFAALEQALDACEVHGHRGYVEATTGQPEVRKK